MGNTPPTPTSLRLSNSDYSYQLQIPGTSASIYFRGRHSSVGLTSWEVSYMVDSKPSCTITLITDSMALPGAWGLSIYIKEDNNTYGHNGFSFRIPKNDDQGLLLNPTLNVEIPFMSSTTNNALREVVTTKLYFYGHGKRLSLLVSQWKRKTSDEDPYTGTIVHYYTNTEKGQDIGLSVALKGIRAISDDIVDYAVDGPEQHPVGALLYMFDYVKRTKTWKPNCCPHCAKNIIKKQRAGIWQSETEDSDIDNNVYTALVRGRERQHDARSRGGLVDNGGGIFNGGHDNGSVKIKNLILALMGNI